MLRKTEQAIDEVKVAAKETAIAIKRELESVPNPLLPVKISNDFNVADLEKPTAVHLFNEDFFPKNQIAFNGKFKSRWTVKYNAIFSIGGTTSDPTFALADNVQINGPLGRDNLQLKFQPDNISAQLDFNHHLIYNTVEANPAKNIYTYWNPYIYLETNRFLRNRVFGFGWMTYINRGFRDHWRINIKENEADKGLGLDKDKLRSVDWEINHNLLARHEGFYFNWVLSFLRNDKWFFQTRKFLGGYERNELNTNIELITRPGTINEWQPDKVTVSASYDFRERGLLGIFASHTEPKDSLSKAPDAAPQKTFQEVGFGYRNKLRKDLEFKVKMTTKGLADFFFNYAAAEGLNLHASLQGSMTDRTKKGFLETPLNFGLKIKLEN